MTVKELRVQLLEVFHYAQLFNADKMIVLDGYREVLFGYSNLVRS